MALMEKLVAARSELPGKEIAQALLGVTMAGQPADRGTMPASGDFVRVTVHIVSDNDHERAQMARLMFSLGHHAEVYADAEELLHHAPTSGVILAREREDGRCAALLGQLVASGLWLPLLGFAEQLSIEAVVRGIKTGVLDYLVGAASTANIGQKVQACYAEGAEILKARQHNAMAKRLVDRLSHREGEVLAHLSNGASNKEIARLLAISPRTVEIHRMKMMGKIGAHHSAEAIRIYLEARGAI